MSFKGFKKALNRLPAQVMNKAGKLEFSTDPELNAMAKSFESLEQSTTDLYSASTSFRDSANAINLHHMAFAQDLASIYDLPGADPTIESGAPAARAAHAYAAIVASSQARIAPFLVSLDVSIIQPTEALRDMNKAVHKSIVKCDHKRLDYDRHSQSLAKISARADRSLEDERKMHKMQNVTDEARQVFDEVATRLRTELPIYLQLRTEFIIPIFKIFTEIQYQISTILAEQIDQVAQIGVFDLTSPILPHFTARHAQAQAMFSALRLVPNPGKVAASASGSGSGSGVPSSPTTFYPPPPSYTPPASASPIPNTASYTTPADPTAAATAAAAAAAATIPASPATLPGAFPSSTPTPAPTNTKETYMSPSTSAEAAPAPAPTAPAPTAQAQAQAQAQAVPAPTSVSATSSPYVIALFDYAAQDAGDLSFSEGDRIQVLHRTLDTNDWWKGTCRGKTGVFPANYVKDE